MADFELEDLQGNRYRLRRGSGPGLYHPENLCTGGNFDAELLLGHFSTSNIDDSFNHFYFDVLSKLDDRPSCPRQALTKAIAANYLTLEKVDTARAVDDEIPDDRPFLRVQIENALRQIVEGERREAAMHQRQMDKESTVMKGLIYTGAFMTGIGSSAWGLAVQVKELSDVINPFVKMQHHAKALRDAWESDNFADTYAETYLSGEKRELVEAIGFDPSQITQQQIDEAIAMTDLVLNDETLRDILYRFVKDYAEAQHSIEVTEVAGSGAFELILTIIVAAVTGGAGVVAAVGSKMHLVRKFSKVGDLLGDFAQATKRIKLRKKVFNGKNKGPGKLESVDGSVKKTDAHGAETGAISGQNTGRQRTKDRISNLSSDDKAKIQSVSTFKAHGISNQEARRFLQETPEGKELFEHALKAAGKDADVNTVINRCIGYLNTGKELPTKVDIKTPLVKIVPKGNKVSGYSPFFTTPEGLEQARRSGQPLSDVFGLPASNDSAVYSVYKMEPNGTATVFESQIAPTSELDGKFNTEGGGQQMIVADRSQFSEPKLVDEIEDY